MTCTVHVAWDEGSVDHHFGPDRPMAPVRVELTMRLGERDRAVEPARRDPGRPGPGH